MEETLSIAEFERLLSRGRGKAILYLQEHDAAPYLETIGYCCLTNTAYGRQCKDPRETYLMDAIALSGEQDLMCEVMIQELHEHVAAADNLQQVFALLGQFTLKGYPMAHQAMYAWCRVHFEPQQFRSEILSPLLELDGVKAFLFLLDPRQANRFFDMESDDYYEFSAFLDVLENRLGKLEVRQSLQQAVQGRPTLAHTIEIIYERQRAAEHLRAERVAQEREWQNLSYLELKHRIESERTTIGHSLHYWGQKASEADFRAAALDFNTLERSTGYLLLYVHMFRLRPFPLDDLSRLFDLVYMNGDPPSQYVNPVTLGALQHLTSSQVRAFALSLIARYQYTGRAVGLLANNFEVGDWTLIESLFDEDLDDHDCHDLGFSIQKVFKKNPSPDAIPALIRMYDANPCSRCREDVVESLVSLNALPDWMAEECRYDANLDLRDYAERGFIDDTDADPDD